MNSTPAVAVVISEPLREDQGDHQVADQRQGQHGPDHVDHGHHSRSTPRTSRASTVNTTTVPSTNIRSDTRTSPDRAAGIGRRGPYKPLIRGRTAVFTKYL